MPIVQVNLLDGRSDAQKRKMVAAITQALVETIDTKPEKVRIIVNDMAHDSYAIGGKMADEQ
jgi:4-oxalocrotonate tautomerase